MSTQLNRSKPPGTEPPRMWVGDDESQAETCTLEEGLAGFILDGALRPADEESETEVRELRRLNPEWQRGDTRIPKVPKAAPVHLYSRGALKQVRVHAPPRFENREPRRQNVRSTPKRANGPPGEDDSESDPPLEVVSLSRFWRDVRRWEEGATA